MKTKFVLSLIVGVSSFFSATLPAHAQIPVSDVASIQQQILQYTQQGLQYTRQGLQLQNELKNLINNPASLLGADIGGLINGVGKIMSNGNAIGGNMARISNNFDSTFKSNNQRSLSENFTRWNSTSTDTLQGAMKAAGLHRDSYQTDTDALTALYNQSQASEGAVQAVQTVAKINAAQVQQLQKLGDLMATQNIAAATYMAEQTSRNEAMNKDSEAMKKAFADAPWSIPTIEKETGPRRKWDMYSPK